MAVSYTENPYTVISEKIENTSSLIHEKSESLPSQNKNMVENSTAIKKTPLQLLHEELIRLQIERDQKLGITSKTTNNGHVIARNAKDQQARKVGAFNKITDEYNYKILALNYLMTYIKIKERLDPNSEIDVATLRNDIFDQIEVHRGKPKAMQKAVALWLHQRLLDDLKKSESLASYKILPLFNRFSHAIALENPTPAVQTTITLDNGHTYRMVDTPVVELTGELKQELKNRKSKLWYQWLSKEDQAVVEYCCEQLDKGDRQIPAQLRSLMPGIRNAFKFQIFHVALDKKETLIQECFHAGTSVTIVKTPEGIPQPEVEAEMLRLTMLNMEQQRHMASSKGNPIDTFLITLTSRFADFGIELKAYVKKIIGHLFTTGALPASQDMPFMADDRPATLFPEKAAEHLASEELKGERRDCLFMDGAAEFLNTPTQFSVSNIVSNGLRAATSDNLSGVEKLLNKAETILAEHSTEEELRTAYVALKEAYEQRNSRISYLAHNLKNIDLLDKEFLGAEILERSIQLNHLINEIMIKQPHTAASTNLLPQALWFGCASGDNRTGAMSAQIAIATIKNNLIKQGVKLTPELEHEIANRVMQSYHVQVVIGIGQGGVSGARPKSTGSLRNEYKEFKDYLYTPVADTKKSLPKDPRLSVLQRLKNFFSRKNQKEIPATGSSSSSTSGVAIMRTIKKNPPAATTKKSKKTTTPTPSANTTKAPDQKKPTTNKPNHPTLAFKVHL